MRKLILMTSVLLLAAGLTLVSAGEDDKAEKRAKIDEMAEEALGTLLSESANAKELHGKAYGFAVFDNLKIAVGVSGGGGQGVAVAKETGARTYMKMGTGGIGLGLGGQKYQIVFFFENQKAFDKFVDKGWQADAGAQAAAGTEGAAAKTTFHDGLAVFMMTDKGLMASADISGTKYWKNKKLNDEE